MSDNPALKSLNLLLVDDEENILKSIRRALLREPYKILTARRGEEALEILEHNLIDLIISDARMPGMDGATLLTEVQKRWPRCMRILMTGYADLATTIKAINEGKIYRYISKPWDDDELRMVIRQAMEFHTSELERKRLERLTQEQNKNLLELNHTLEQRVKERTAELEQTAEMVETAYQELSQSYVKTTLVFSSLIDQRMPSDRHSNSQVITLIKRFCQHYKLEPDLTRNLSMAASLYNLGKLTWDDEMLKQSSNQLHKNYRETYRQYPAIGESLLMALEPLQGAAKLIRHHQERWAGGGFPDGIKGKAIPAGARILRLAVDFVELRQGVTLNKPMSHEDTLAMMKKYSGQLYEPHLCGQFIQLMELSKEDEQEGSNILLLRTDQLKPGMRLARNLYSDKGTLIIYEDKILNTMLIDKLREFEKSEQSQFELAIHTAQRQDLKE
ncbi:HD domain-containing phosphohydrolase [Nitrincola sp. MINF-07-Sa-05]|uniref:HD domain-containing phosphohydrolase n=1 Tax=Nitrincola salilacus TaxID=3400273 RepID=UPI003917BE08